MAWCSSVASSTSDSRDGPATTAEQHNSAAMDGFLGFVVRHYAFRMLAAGEHAPSG